jgi:phosphoglycolate phosphatase
MQRYRLAIFDYDGTLANSERAIVKAMTAACVGAGVRDLDSVPLADWIGLPLPDMVTLILENRSLAASGRQAILDGYSAAYPALCAQYTRLYDGMEAVLAAVRAADMRAAVATNKGRAALALSLQNLQIAAFFTTLRTPEAVKNIKPDPEMVHSIMAELAVKADETVMIGDTTYDMEMGRRAGVDTIAVTYGMHDWARLKVHTPTFVAATPSALLPILGI